MYIWGSSPAPKLHKKGGLLVNQMAGNETRNNFFRTITIILAVLLAGCSVYGPAKIEIVDLAVLEAKVSGLSTEDLNFSCICDVSTIQTTTPVFMTIYNKGGETDWLVKVETEQAARVEFRRGGGEGDLLGAEPVSTVEVRGLGKAEFRNGQYSMILTGVKDDIRPGDPVKLILYFEKSGAIEVVATARKR